MPVVKSLSDFNRNQTSVIEELKETQQPVYLTRNGTASIVVMDAQAFDREMSFRASIYANEMRVYGSLLKGYSDYENGDIVSAEEAESRIAAEKGWN